MSTTRDTDIDALGPGRLPGCRVPAKTTEFHGRDDELMRLSESDLARILDIVLISKDEDGSVSAMELDGLADVDEIRALESDLAEILAADDIAHLAAAMEPGTVAGAIVWENVWAAPFPSAARRAGGQLIATGRIPIQAIAASLQAEFADDQPEAEGN